MYIVFQDYIVSWEIMSDMKLTHLPADMILNGLNKEKLISLYKSGGLLEEYKVMILELEMIICYHIFLPRIIVIMYWGNLH